MKRFLIIAATVALSPLAVADSTLVFSNQDEQSSSVQSSNGQVRVEQAGNDGVYMLYDQASQMLTMVNSNDKTYQQITQARIEEAAAKIADAKQKLRDNFDKLTPEQQQQLQPMIAKMALAEAREQRIEKLKTAKVAGVKCQEHQVYSNDQAAQKLCAANAKALKIPAADFDAIAAMLDMLAELSNKMGGGMMQAAISPTEIGGIPVRTVEADNKGHTSLQSVSKKALDSSRFSVPAGFREIQSR